MAIPMYSPFPRYATLFCGALLVSACGGGGGGGGGGNNPLSSTLQLDDPDTAALFHMMTSPLMSSMSLSLSEGSAGEFIRNPQSLIAFGALTAPIPCHDGSGTVRLAMQDDTAPAGNPVPATLYDTATATHVNCRVPGAMFLTGDITIGVPAGGNFALDGDRLASPEHLIILGSDTAPFVADRPFGDPPVTQDVRARWFAGPTEWPDQEILHGVVEARVRAQSGQELTWSIKGFGDTPQAVIERETQLGQLLKARARVAFNSDFDCPLSGYLDMEGLYHRNVVLTLTGGQVTLTSGQTEAVIDIENDGHFRVTVDGESYEYNSAAANDSDDYLRYQAAAAAVSGCFGNTP